MWSEGCAVVGAWCGCLTTLTCLLTPLWITPGGADTAGNMNVTVVRFQADGLATTDSMLDTDVGILPALTQVTMCAHYRIIHSGENNNPIVSYFSGTDNELFLAVDFKKQEVQVNCCSFRVVQDVAVTIRMYRWHHLCVALHLPSGRYWLVHDEQFSEGVLEGGEGATVRGGGRLVMGQDIDSIDGGFNVRQSIHGDIAHFLLYSKALDPEILKAYVKCHPLTTSVEPRLSIDKNITQFKVVDSTEISMIQLADICREQPKSLIMVPEKLNFHSSYRVCSKLKGRMAVPTSVEENTKLFSEFLKFNDLCVDAYGTLYWVGVKGDLDSGQWLILPEKNPLTWSNLVSGYDTVKESQQCVSVGGADFPLEWYSTPCEYLTCPLCTFADIPSFRVRGLCSDSYIDKILYLVDYRNDKVQFHGPYYTGLHWDLVNMTWKISSRGHEELVGYMTSERPGATPIGVNTWIFYGDKCLTPKTEVLITACGEGEYTCNDGSCVKKTQRCDLSTDCPDLSDELNCQLAVIPDGYTLEMPPPMELDKPVPIQIFVEITSVRDMDILGFKMVLDIILRLYWRDARISLKNLRTDVHSNKIQEHEQLWMPQLQVEDGARSLADMMLRAETLMVEREGRPIPDDPGRLNEDEVYLGSENTLLLQQVYTVDFTCQFQLQFYPFDVQLCSLSFTLIGVSPSFVVLKKRDEGVAFTGQKKLLEYQVTFFNMTPEQHTHAASQRVWLELRNLYGYYVSNTYLPTLLLVFICYLTLFFDIADFTDRVMVSLTSLLVLAALFSQTSQAIPKTSYLKLIDLWFVFLIVVEFVIVLILVVVENLRLMKNAVRSSKVTVISVSSSKDKYSHSKGHVGENVNGVAFKTNRGAIVVLPILMTIFILGYAAFCLTGDSP